MSAPQNNDPHEGLPEFIELPTPTAWPIVTAFGITLLLAGLVTNLFISAVGLVAGLIGAIGWFGDVYPHPHHEPVPLVPESERPSPLRLAGRKVLLLGEGGHRMHLPADVHPFSAGILGGLAGGLVMAIMAVGYGIVVIKSPWLPINLVAAAAVPSLGEADIETLKAFSLLGLAVATVIHATMSILMGLLYAAMLPMLPRKLEWLWGGILIPLIWSLGIRASVGMISPVMGANISWTWFFICQVAFGLVGGYVVFKSGRIETMQSWPISAKLGVEAQHREEGTK